MASSKWKTYSELNKLDRNFIFWGASIWAQKTNKKLKKKIDYIVDKNPNNLKQKFLNKKIVSNKYLFKQKKRPYIIISTANYTSVEKELIKNHFVPGEDFCVTPELLVRESVENFLNLEKIIIFSSPEHFSNKNKGGGIYELNSKSGDIKKKIIGKFRGISKINNNLFCAIDMLKGIVIFNKNYKIIKIIKLDNKCEAHGIFYDKFTKNFFVAQPGRDSIGIYSFKKKKKIKEIFISDKWKKNSLDNHHLNDLYVDKKFIYISLFSRSGNWSKDIYDGGIIKIKKNNFSTKTFIKTKRLWMPHSVNKVGKKIVYLESMTGSLIENKKIITQFNGFVRGVDYKDNFYFIAMSKHRYPEKLKGISKNISLDCGIYKFERNTSYCKFYAVHATEAIHSVIIR